MFITYPTFGLNTRTTGATNTEMLNASLRRFMDDNQLDAFVKGLPKGRLIDPEDV